MKLYALRVVENKDSLWRPYAYSHDTTKLTSIVMGNPRGWFLGKSDVTNNKYEVMFTEKEVYPQYSIVEVPFLV